MRLFERIQGRFKQVSHKLGPDMHSYEEYIRSSAKSDGTIENLVIDFCGEFIPLNSIEEARLAGIFLHLHAITYMSASKTIDEYDRNPEYKTNLSEDEFYSYSDEDNENTPQELDPTFEMNETLGEPEFGKAHMVDRLW